jgi:type VI secretion system protein VasD
MKYNISIRPLTIHQSLIALLIVLLLASLLIGCGKDKVKEKVDKPADVVIRIKTTGDLNPDIKGRPSPIILRIYSLKSDDAFNNARFFELYENGDETLGADLLWQQELEFSPNEALQLDKMTLDSAARHLGFLAAYRDLDSAKWRGTIAIPVNRINFIHVTLDQLSVSVGRGSKKSTFLED